MSKCKSCHKQAARERRKANPERAREIDRRKYERRREAHLAKCREYRENNADAIRESQRRWEAENAEHVREYKHSYYDRHREEIIERVGEYQRTPEGREVHAAALRRWNKENPEKKRAQQALNNAIRDGRLERGRCEVCGIEGHGHHEDYDKPLEVRWLCPTHHQELHKGRRRGAA